MTSARSVSKGGMTKSRAAAVSIASNSALIALKLAAAAVTGSVAILSEALHSMIDLIASVVAFVSVRKADEPADVDHPYGHEKVENVGAAIEAMLILVGAGVIVYEAANRLSSGAEVDQLGLGIAVIAFSALANVGVSRFLLQASQAAELPCPGGRCGAPGHRCLHLRRSAARFAVGPDHRRERHRLHRGDLGRRRDRGDRVSACCVSRRGSWSMRLRRPRRWTGSRQRSQELVTRLPRSSGTTSCVRGPRVAGPTSTCTCSSLQGTTLEHAHEVAHRLRDAIESDLGDAEVLIHVEPESSKHDPAESPSAFRAG